MSDLLGIGLSGLTAYRSALATVGENVANAETPGYARRIVRMTQLATDGTNDLQYREGLRFNGVAAVSVSRAYDIFRAAEARHASAGAGRGAVREQWMTGIERALDDGPAGIGRRVTAFFSVADTLAAAPDDNLNRSRFLMALEDVAGAFRTTGSNLARISTSVGEAAGMETTGLNQSLTALADINRSLLTAPPGGTTRAALEDQRDKLIDSIAGSIDILASYDDHGAATVRMADAPGATLLAPGETGQVTVNQAADGRLSLQLTNNSGTIAIAPATGKLAGYVDVSNTTADRRAALDALAGDFASQINAWSGAGFDQVGNAGMDLLDASLGASGMTASVTDPALVPAASATSRNGNLLALDALRGPNGAEQRWTAMVSGHAVQLASAKSEAAATAAWKENSFAALDETTGIDLDREAGDLLRFQQAYSASARIVQVGREIFNDLLNAL